MKGLVVPHRVFQGAGLLLQLDDTRLMRRNQKKLRYVFLFSDLMLVTKFHRHENKYRLKLVIVLNNIIVLEHYPQLPQGTSPLQSSSLFLLHLCFCLCFCLNFCFCLCLLPLPFAFAFAFVFCFLLLKWKRKSVASCFGVA